MNVIRNIVLTLGLTFAVCLPSQAAVIELSLALDGSGSINNAEFALQVDAYESIFGGGTFYDDFVTTGDTLWVNLIVFGTTVDERIAFTSITDNASATAFSLAVGAVNRSGLGSSTNTYAATNLAAGIITGNAIVSDRRVIDVSTDGVPTADSGTPGTSADNAIAAATAANAAGITVNAIGVGNGIGATFLGDYTTAGGGFFVTAANFAEFETVLARKLRKEITGGDEVPVPGTLALMALGLTGLGFRFRKAA